MIEIYLSKQEAFDADPKAILQINYVLDFSKGNITFL